MDKPILEYDVPGGAHVTLFKQDKQYEKQTSNKFYTVEPVKKRVSHAEFIEFLKNYPRPLTFDAFGACDPPAISYNDFELANRWPYSIVANTWAYDDNPNDYFYAPEEKKEYYIVENFEELFNSKTGYMEDYDA